MLVKSLTIISDANVKFAFRVSVSAVYRVVDKNYQTAIKVPNMTLYMYTTKT